MVLASLMFEHGIGREDPTKLLAMPIRQIIFWYDLAVAFAKLRTKKR